MIVNSQRNEILLTVMMWSCCLNTGSVIIN